MQVKIFISHLLALALVYALAPSSSAQNLIETTCLKTPHYAACLRNLHADPRSATTDTVGLARIMIGAIRAKTKHAVDMLNKWSSYIIEHKALENCLNVYDTVLKVDVPKADKALPGNPKAAADALAVVPGKADSCDAGFNGSPIKDEDNDLRVVTKVAIAMVKNLQ